MSTPVTTSEQESPLPVHRTAFRMAASRATGWAADLKVPTFFRKTLYRGYAFFTGADLNEAAQPLETYPSLGAFFIRRLKSGARTIDDSPGGVASPVDGKVLSVGRIEEGTMLQIKGRRYSVRDLVGSDRLAALVDGGLQWSIYLGPRDYHRIHAPENITLERVHWLEGARYSVNPKVLAKRLVLPVNERVVLELESERGPLLLVLVGALNVGRMRVVGVEPGAEQSTNGPTAFERGAELARFEMGSTIVLLSPKGARKPSRPFEHGEVLRLGQKIGEAL